MNSFYIILFLSLIPLLYFAFNTKELPFFLPNFNTDNEKLLTAASKIKIFDWPSKVHTIENLGDQARSHSREYYTIVCAIFLKIFRKAKNDHITALVGLFANFVSTLLIYIIFSNYFNQNIGFLASLIYLTSFWSFHIILFIGHVILSQMFFLLCILTIQVAEDQSFNIQLILVDNWIEPSINLPKLGFELSSKSLDVLHIPSGYLTSIEGLDDNSILLAMSDYGLNEINDDYKFPNNYFKI